MTLCDDPAHRDARDIFLSALARVDPAPMLRNAVAVVNEGSGRRLRVRTELGGTEYDLCRFDRIVVTGMGKASARMALGLEAALGDAIDGGVVAVKVGHVETLARIALVEAAHPVPDASSVEAARAVLDPVAAISAGSVTLPADARPGAFSRPFDERTLVIVLISGGGSSILCAPAAGLSLADKAATTKALLASGATIHEVNCVRKHLSAVKGGRLAASYAPATVLSLVLSDVIGDDLDAIASGPTVPDTTTFADALEVVRRYGIESRVPSAALALLEGGAAGMVPDTPKPQDPLFARSTTMLLGSNRLALLAAEAKARSLGYETLALTSRLSGEAREMALLFLGAGKDIAASGFPLRRPACILAGGETTVTLRGPGLGGRNQEMALAFLDAMLRFPGDAQDLVFLAASTDGSDGPTDAAGAFASLRVAERARSAGLSASRALADNDSWHFFEAADGLLKTGPTNTNVCDIQVLLVP